MNYERTYLDESRVPQSPHALFQHVVDTYVGETNKVASVWSQFTDADLPWKPAEKSSSVGQIMQHQILSERRFFAEFLGSSEPPANAALPAVPSVTAYIDRVVSLAGRRLNWLAQMDENYWLQTARFFDVDRQHIWIFWRRILHTAHHRTQLTMYLRLLNRPVPSTYGPTADVTWDGADPTLTATP